MSIQSFLDRQVVDYCRVDVTGACAHHQAFERRQAHRGVDRLSGSNRRRRASITEVKRDHICLIGSEVPDLTIAIGDIAMRCSVKTVTTSSITAIELIRNRVEICAFRKRLMKRGIEHRDLRKPGS